MDKELDDHYRIQCINYMGLLEELKLKSKQTIEWLVRNRQNPKLAAQYEATKKKFNALEIDIYRAEFWLKFAEVLRYEDWVDYILIVPKDMRDGAVIDGYKIDISGDNTGLGVMLPSQLSAQEMYKILAKHGANDPHPIANKKPEETAVSNALI